MTTKQNENSRIIYRGPSKLDGSPIVVIATGYKTGSSNSKTGAMIQTWIILENTKPQTAVEQGSDSAVCGDCPHRGVASGGLGSCYVKLFHAPRSVWECYTKGSGYPEASLQELAELNRDRAVRIGSYGDPAAVPVAVWRAFVRHASTVTGYTHQWRSAPYLKPYVMASCDSVADYQLAQSKGWRTFRVRSESEIQTGEIGCPAAEENGRKTNCENCGLCNGTSSKARVSITIQAHGATSSRFVEFAPTLKIAA